MVSPLSSKSPGGSSSAGGLQNCGASRFTLWTALLLHSYILRWRVRRFGRAVQNHTEMPRSAGYLLICQRIRGGGASLTRCFCLRQRSQALLTRVGGLEGGFIVDGRGCIVKEHDTTQIGRVERRALKYPLWIRGLCNSPLTAVDREASASRSLHHAMAP